MMLVNISLKKFNEISTMTACFLDRDGVFNVDLGYAYKEKNRIIIDGLIEALKLLPNDNYKLFIVTNQSGVSRGLFTLESVISFNEILISILESEGIEISASVICSHHFKANESCNFRKPKPSAFTSYRTNHGYICDHLCL